MRKLIIALILILTTSLTLFAQSAEEAVNVTEDAQGFGIRAAGLGNAFVGVADDYSAIYWNPAGLAQMRKGEFYGSLQQFNFRTKAEYLSSETNSDRSFTKLKSFGLVYPFPVIQGSLVMALGYQRFKTLDSYTEFGGLLRESNSLAFDIKNDLGEYGVLPFDQNVTQKQVMSNDGNLSAWSAAVAISLSPNFMAGAAVNLIGGGSNYDMRYMQDDYNNSNAYQVQDENGVHIEDFFYNYYDVNQKLNSDYSAVAFKLGGLFQLGSHLRFGAGIDFPYSLHVKENWSVNDELSYDITVLAEDVTYNYIEQADLDDGTFDYNIEVPFKFRLGGSYRSEHFLVAAGAEYQDFTQMKYQMPDDRDPRDYSDLLDQNSVFGSDFRAVLSYSFGGEISLFRQQLHLRGGYRFVPSPFKNADKSYDKQYFSAGIGYRIDPGATLEAAYTLGTWQRDKAYSYDWDYDGSLPLMVTHEKYATQKILFGVRLAF